MKRYDIFFADNGEILGITLRFQDRKKVLEYFGDNLTGPAPKLLKGASLALISAIRNCVLSPIFLPLKGHPGNKVIIEVDVRPNSYHCGTTIFWMWGKYKGKSIAKLQFKNDCRKYYLREDTSTRKIDMSDKKEEKYLKKVVEDNAGLLQSWSPRQLGDIPTEQKIVNIVRGVMDMRSDNYVMRSITKCLNAWDMSVNKNSGILLGTLINILQTKLWKRWTPDDQIEYKKKVDTSGKDTIIYDPTKHGHFKDWMGFTPSQIRKEDGVKSVRVIRPGLTKQEVKPLSDRDLEKVVKEFKKQRAKGDEKITVGFLNRLGKKHGFTMGRVACLNMGAQNDVGTLTPSVSDWVKCLNEEFPTIIYAQILTTIRAQWHRFHFK